MLVHILHARDASASGLAFAKPLTPFSVPARGSLGAVALVRTVTRAAFRYNGFDRFAHIAVRLVYIGATAPGAEPIVICALLALVRWTSRLVHTLTQVGSYGHVC